MLSFIPILDLCSISNEAQFHARPQKYLGRFFVPVAEPTTSVRRLMDLIRTVWSAHVELHRSYYGQSTLSDADEVCAVWTGSNGRIVPLTNDDIVLLDAIALTPGCRGVVDAPDDTIFGRLDRDSTFKILRGLDRDSRRAALASSRTLQAMRATFAEIELDDGSEIFVEMRPATVTTGP